MNFLLKHAGLVFVTLLLFERIGGIDFRLYQGSCSSIDR